MYNKYSKQYDCWCKYYDNIDEEMRIIHKYITFHNANILEVGCGTGRFTERILLDKPLSVMAIDNDLQSISIATENVIDDCVEFIELDANEIENQFVTKQFDYVVFSWSLNYIPNYNKVLSAAIKCCKPKGKIIIMFPCDSEYLSLINSVRLYEDINYFSDEFYYSIKTFFANRNINLLEDEIISEFIYPNEINALEHNLFHWDVINNSLTEFEISCFMDKLFKFRKENGTICIQDKVKLLIGG